MIKKRDKLILDEEGRQLVRFPNPLGASESENLTRRQCDNISILSLIIKIFRQ